MSEILGYLAGRFVTQSENLATEGLKFILQRSPAAVQALVDLASSVSVPLPSNLMFRSQEGQYGKGIPDLTGFDADGKPRLLIEAKFWAGLTDHQPASYLERFEADHSGLLLFVVPSLRIEHIWGALAQNAAAKGFQLPKAVRHEEVLHATLDQNRTLAVASFPFVLGRMDTALASAGEKKLEGDLAQLRGLVEVEDRAAFLPLAAEQITDLGPARRLIGLIDLVDDACTRIVEAGVGSTKGLRETHGWYSAGRYIRLGGVGAWVGQHLRLWRDYGVSPLWATFGPTDFGQGPRVLEQLAGWRHTEPLRCFEDDGDAAVPLLLTSGIERTELLEFLVQQLCELADKIKPIGDSMVSELASAPPPPARQAP